MKEQIFTGESQPSTSVSTRLLFSLLLEHEALLFHGSLGRIEISLIADMVPSENWPPGPFHNRTRAAQTRARRVASPTHLYLSPPSSFHDHNLPNFQASICVILTYESLISDFKVSRTSPLHLSFLRPSFSPRSRSLLQERKKAWTPLVQPGRGSAQAQNLSET